MDDEQVFADYAQISSLESSAQEYRDHIASSLELLVEEKNNVGFCRKAQQFMLDLTAP